MLLLQAEQDRDDRDKAQFLFYSPVPSKHHSYAAKHAHQITSALIASSSSTDGMGQLSKIKHMLVSQPMVTAEAYLARAVLASSCVACKACSSVLTVDRRPTLGDHIISRKQPAQWR
jgi:hypothetical protein